MMTKEQLIAFEAKVADLWRAGEINSLFHLSGGNEDQLIQIFQSIRPQDWVFSTHRSHYHYLLKGGNPDVLLSRILAGQSMFIFDRELNFFTSSILAGTCGIACGVALAIQRNKEDRMVHCFLGDGASDQGHFYEALKFAESAELPVRFILEDNDRSCDSTSAQRHAQADTLVSSCLWHYRYTPTYPHCQAPSAGKIAFKKETP